MPTESKSKSETPRTDNESAPYDDERFEGDDCVPAYFARQIEKELNEAHKQIELLKAVSNPNGTTAKILDLEQERNNLAKQLEGMINGQEQDQKYIEELTKENKAMRSSLEMVKGGTD